MTSATSVSATPRIWLFVAGAAAAIFIGSAVAGALLVGDQLSLPKASGPLSADRAVINPGQG